MYKVVIVDDEPIIVEGLQKGIEWANWNCEIVGTELADKVGITIANISILKNGKAKALKISTLCKLCSALDCQPGDILEYRPGNECEDNK